MLKKKEVKVDLNKREKLISGAKKGAILSLGLLGLSSYVQAADKVYWRKSSGALTDLTPNLTPSSGDFGFFNRTGTTITPKVNTDDLTTTGTGSFGQIIDTGLTASKGVYTDASKQLTSNPPSTGSLGYWDRTGTELTPATTDDTLKMVSSISSLPNISGSVSISIDASPSYTGYSYSSMEGTTNVKIYGYKDVGALRIYTSNYIEDTFDWDPYYSAYSNARITVTISESSGEYDGYFAIIDDDHTERTIVQNFYVNTNPFYYSPYLGWENITSTTDTPTLTTFYTKNCMIETNGICGEDGTDEITITTDARFNEDVRVLGDITIDGSSTTLQNLTVGGDASIGNCFFDVNASTSTGTTATGIGANGLVHRRSTTARRYYWDTSYGHRWTSNNGFMYYADNNNLGIIQGVFAKWIFRPDTGAESVCRDGKLTIGINTVSNVISGATPETLNIGGNLWVIGTNNGIQFNNNGTSPKSKIYDDGTDLIIDPRLSLAGILKITEDTDVDGRVTEQGTYAGICTHDNSTAQSIPTGTTYTKITNFTTNNLSSNCTADYTNNKITITKTGVYKVNGSFSISASVANILWLGAAFWNGVEQDCIHFRTKLTTANAETNASFTGFIDVTSVPTDVDFRIRHDNGASQNLTMTYGNLNVEYMGET